jgi:hypothetical protein
MPQARRRLLRAAAVLGAFALAVHPARADRLTYSLQDVLPGQTVPAGAPVFANLAPLRSVADGGNTVDPSYLDFSPRPATGETGVAGTHDRAFPWIVDQTRRARLSFYTPAVAPDHLAGAFVGVVYPAGGRPGEGIVIQEVLRPARFSTMGNRDPIRRSFSDPAGRLHAAEEFVADAHDGQSTSGGVTRQFSQATEPPTFVLFALGAAGLLGASWRRRRFELSAPNPRPRRRQRRRRGRPPVSGRSGWDGAGAA